jgi:para-aminobenzoate synthetase/4-amino-4-deoxychorismate lyase
MTTNACFALLEDCGNPTGASENRVPARSRLYTGYSRRLRCHNAADLPALLAEMQAALAGGAHAVALLHYELGARMQGIAPFGDEDNAQPLAEILLFTECRLLTAAAVEKWLADQPSDADAHVVNLRADTDRAGFDRSIARIRAYIAAGDCYQVNYTYRLHFDLHGSPLALYRQLRKRQPTRYGALIMLPDGGAVVSCSPELFMQHAAGTLTVQPMKGTAAAEGDADRDAVNAAALASDPKNRAENLMIVDLLRNDLGRIAETGSVQVTEMFKVERFQRLLQMTSTIQAKVRADAGLYALIGALYPCGSITGAPKLRAMAIIRELETAPRGLYTGGLGWFDGSGDFCLSVPIRTVTLAPPVRGRSAGAMGVGAGIVHDSVAADEFDECQLKARFLSGLPHSFQLFETIYATGRAGCRHLEQHLARLAHSAARCGFTIDMAHVRTMLNQANSKLMDAGPEATDAPHRLRLTLAQDGVVTVTAAPLPALQEPVTLFIADGIIDSDDFFTAHKTTVRAAYDAAWRQAEALGGFDHLFFNQSGQLTEGGRSNIFLRLQGRWHTPHLKAGLLPGVMRSVLLADPAWRASERILTLEDLHNAEEIVVCNALRGPLRAIIDWRA